jgi:hypothetical protein
MPRLAELKEARNRDRVGTRGKFTATDTLDNHRRSQITKTTATAKNWLGDDDRHAREELDVETRHAVASRELRAHNNTTEETWSGSFAAARAGTTERYARDAKASRTRTGQSRAREFRRKRRGSSRIDGTTILAEQGTTRDHGRLVGQHEEAMASDGTREEHARSRTAWLGTTMDGAATHARERWREERESGVLSTGLELGSSAWRMKTPRQGKYGRLGEDTQELQRPNEWWRCRRRRWPPERHGQDWRLLRLEDGMLRAGDGRERKSSAEKSGAESRGPSREDAKMGAWPGNWAGRPGDQAPWGKASGGGDPGAVSSGEERGRAMEEREKNIGAQKQRTECGRERAADTPRGAEGWRQQLLHSRIKKQRWTAVGKISECACGR